MAGLWDHRSAARHTPCESHLGRCAVAFASDFCYDGVLEERLGVAGGVDGVCACEGRVGGNVDVAVGVPLEEVGLLEVGVEFHLMDAGFVGGV